MSRKNIKTGLVALALASSLELGLITAPRAEAWPMIPNAPPMISYSNLTNNPARSKYTPEENRERKIIFSTVGGIGVAGVLTV